MTAGELLINIGLLGAPEALAGIRDITKGIRGIATEALQAFATVTGLIGAFGALATASGDSGARLQRFSNLTGESTKNLQDWEGTLTAVNVTIAETDAALLKIKDAFNSQNRAVNTAKVAGLLFHAGIHVQPELLNSDKFTTSQINEYFASLRKQVHSAQNLSFYRQALEPIVGSSVVSGFLDPRFKGLQHNPLDRDDKTVLKLAKIRADIENFKQQIEHAFDSFLLKNFKQIKGVVQQIIDLIPAFTDGVGEATTVAAGIAKDILSFAKDHPDIVKAMGALSIALTLASSPMIVLASALVGFVELFKHFTGNEQKSGDFLVNKLAADPDLRTPEGSKTAAANKFYSEPFSISALYRRLDEAVDSKAITIINNLGLAGGVGPEAIRRIQDAATTGTKRGLHQGDLDKAQQASTGKHVAN